MCLFFWSDNLRSVNIASRDAQEILQTITRSFLDHTYKGVWQVTSTHLVQNKELEETYRWEHTISFDSFDGHGFLMRCSTSLSTSLQRFLTVFPVIDVQSTLPILVLYSQSGIYGMRWLILSKNIDIDIIWTNMYTHLQPDSRNCKQGTRQKIWLNESEKNVCIYSLVD